MTDDSIEKILDDCNVSPKVYCYKHDCGQGIYDELADYVPDMCVHLVGRTEAVVRHNLCTLKGSGFSIGDRVMRKNGRTGEVIGFAIGKDGEKCLVLSMHDGHWKTYLCPISEAMHLKVPTMAEVKCRIEQAIEDAAENKGDYLDTEAAAAYIIEMMQASFDGRPFPVGGAS